MASDSTYKPLYPDRDRVHDTAICQRGNLLSCDCWYSWGWVVAFYDHDEGGNTRKTYENIMRDIKQHNGYFWKGYDDGEHARLESQESGIIHT